MANVHTHFFFQKERISFLLINYNMLKLIYVQVYVYVCVCNRVYGSDFDGADVWL